MKDNFSKESDKYVRYRPTYPAELYQYINTITPGKASAWDCGTGNGQVALELAKSFDQVQATDISQAQLDHAPYADNIKYSVQSAEDTHFSDASFDLVTVAQAIHWFDFDLFYKEVSRTAKKGAVICVIGYARLEITPEIDEVITRFYTDIIGPYWDPERRYVDDGYQTIPFPYEEIETPTYARIHNTASTHIRPHITL